MICVIMFAIDYHVLNLCVTLSVGTNGFLIICDYSMLAGYSVLMYELHQINIFPKMNNLSPLVLSAVSKRL